MTCYCYVVLCQGSPSDDELEYSSAGRVSSSGGAGNAARAAAAARRRRSSAAGGVGGRKTDRRGGGADDNSSSSDDSDSSDSSSSSAFSAGDDWGGGQSPVRPSQLALHAAAVLAGGSKEARAQLSAAQLEELSFATHLVGPGGAGYEWRAPEPAAAAAARALHSIAPPPAE